MTLSGDLVMETTVKELHNKRLPTMYDHLKIIQ